MTLETRLLANGFAVEIAGVDLGLALDDSTIGKIRDLWMRNKVAVFRDQDVGDDALVEFSRRLGVPF